MVDKFTKEKRSAIMSLISGKETKPEILVRKYLFSRGFRYRKNVTILPGKPDIVLPKYRTVIFIHGCFWHGHQNCNRAILPSSKTHFWQEKISKNIAREQTITERLIADGWKLIIVWQCELSSKQKRESRLNELVKQIHAN